MLAKAILKASPERSNRDIARFAKVSDKTVTAARRSLEATAEIPQLDTTTGADGKARPARRGSKGQASQITLFEFPKSLHERPAETLEEVTRLLLRRERAQIANLPLTIRVELARGYLRALDVSLDQL